MSYWLIIDDVQQGPFTLEEVLNNPRLTPTTPVWHEGMDDWAEAQLLPEIEVIFLVEQDSDPFGSGAQEPAPEPQQQSAPVPNPLPPFGQGGYQQPTGQPRPEWWNNDDRNRKMPPNYLVLAIITTICCCIFTGVVAIYYSSQVSGAFYRGDYERAQQLSEKAGLWVIISFVAGLVFYPFYFLYQFVAFAG